VLILKNTGRNACATGNAGIIKGWFAGIPRRMPARMRAWPAESLLHGDSPNAYDAFCGEAAVCYSTVQQIFFTYFQEVPERGFEILLDRSRILTGCQ
jgi:hypothetical protein